MTPGSEATVDAPPTDIHADDVALGMVTYEAYAAGTPSAYDSWHSLPPEVKGAFVRAGRAAVEHALREARVRKETIADLATSLVAEARGRADSSVMTAMTIGLQLELRRLSELATGL